MKNHFLTGAVLLAASLSACGPAGPRHDSSDGSWQVMTSPIGKKDMLCYAAAAPEDTAGSLTKRASKPYLMATRRPSGKIEISASAGYDFMPGSKVELAIDDETHQLFFKRDVAWAHGDAEDRAIIGAMKEADEIELRGVSMGGLTSIDSYASDGFAAALKRVRELCP